MKINQKTPFCFRRILLLPLILGWSFLTAQPKENSLTRKELYKQLEKLFDQKNSTERKGNQLETGRLHIQLSRVAEQLGSMDYSSEFIEKACENYSKAGRRDTLPDLYLKLAKEYSELEDKTAVLRNCKAGLAVLSEVENESDEKTRMKLLSIRKNFLTLLNNFTEIGEETEQFERTNLNLLEILSPEKDPGIYAQVSNNLGMARLKQNDAAAAEKFFRQAFQIEEKRSERKSQASRVEYDVNLANALLRQGKIREAERELNFALGLAKEFRLLPQQSRICGLIAKIHLRNNDLMQASLLSASGLELAEKSGASPEVMIDALECHAEILKKTGEYPDAYKLLEKLKDLKNQEIILQKQKLRLEREKKAESKRLERELSNFREIQMTIEKEKIKTEDNNRRARERIDSLRVQSEKDSLQRAIQLREIESRNLQLQKRILEAKSQQEFQEIFSQRLLDEQKFRNKIKLDSLEKQRTEAELKQKISEDQQKNSMREKEQMSILAIMGGICFTIAAFAFIKTRGINRRLKEGQLQIEAANMALAGLNQELNGKNKSITDSIQYARGIQSAILPNPDRWKKTFPDSFVLYEAKDIVSGDFFFHSFTGSKHLVAFADCTGHGVPGALMSIIGHNLLVSAIDLQELTNPGEILEFMDKGLQHTLNQENRENHDGMEIGICSFDFSRDLLEYAGSRRPLFGIRNQEFFEWKGNRRHLGSNRNAGASPEVYSCPISEISNLWLCSDGYADQFGGPLQKRFHTAELKSVLISIAHRSAEEQREELLNRFREWKGSNIQIDDVMIIGIRPGQG